MRWKLLSTCILFAIILYQMIDFKQIKIEEQNTIIHQNGQTFEVKPLGFFANFFANFLAKLAESEKGQELVAKIFRPIEQQNLGQRKAADNFQYINSVFSIKSQPCAQNQDDKIAYCSAQVVVDYKITQGEKIILAEQDKKLYLYNNTIPALDNIIVGMRQGETRKAVIPYWYAGSLKSYMHSQQEKVNGLVAEITLKDMLSPVIKDVKIFDNLTDAGPVLLCGQTTKVKVKITNFKNQVLFNENINFSIGQKTLPIIFSYVLFNKLPAATRSVLAPAKYLLNHDGLLDSKLQSAFNNLEELILIEFQ